MERELLSKKELLELTGISYGQLYRWKRKKLIPEEWFIKKSSFTGQETFFPKELILQRIEKIKNMKDDLQLDDLADFFSPIPANIKMNRSELMKHNIVALSTLETLNVRGEENFSYNQVLSLYVIDKILETGMLSSDESVSLMKVFEETGDEITRENWDFLFCRKRGVSIILLVVSGLKMVVENDLKIILRVNLQKYSEELKLKLNIEENI